MTPAGFEPAHPKITELESVALDHSATMSLGNLRKDIHYSRRGSNPRPLLHKSSALPTELREHRNAPICLCTGAFIRDFFADFFLENLLKTKSLKVIWVLVLCCKIS